MDIVALLAIAVIVAGLAAWGIKKYRLMMADGSISLDEIVESVTEGLAKVEDAQDEIKEVLSDEQSKEA